MMPGVTETAVVEPVEDDEAADTDTEQSEDMEANAPGELPSSSERCGMEAVEPPPGHGSGGDPEARQTAAPPDLTHPGSSQAGQPMMDGADRKKKREVQRERGGARALLPLLWWCTLLWYTPCKGRSL